MSQQDKATEAEASCLKQHEIVMSSNWGSNRDAFILALPWGSATSLGWLSFYLSYIRKIRYPTGFIGNSQVGNVPHLEKQAKKYPVSEQGLRARSD